jgi:hypothetical protein
MSFPHDDDDDDGFSRARPLTRDPIDRIPA